MVSHDGNLTCEADHDGLPTAASHEDFAPLYVHHGDLLSEFQSFHFWHFATKVHVTLGKSQNYMSKTYSEVFGLAGVGGIKKY